MKLKSIYCKQIDCKTNVCDWYECPYGATCEVVKRFYRFVQINDDPDNVQFIDGILFYTPDNIIAPQLNKEEREEVAKWWINANEH